MFTGVTAKLQMLFLGVLKWQEKVVVETIDVYVDCSEHV
jgi:hypothetical protein